MFVTGVNTAEHECKNDTKVRCDYTDYGINNIFFTDKCNFSCNVLLWIQILYLSLCTQ